MHNLDEKYRSILVISSKLEQIGISLNFDRNEDHAFWYILNGLTYGFTHEDKILIATIAKFTKKSLPKKKNIEIFESLLPNIEIIRWLNFMLTLNISLNSEFSKNGYEYNLSENVLKIKSLKKQYIVHKAVEKIQTPDDLMLEYI